MDTNTVAVVTAFGSKLDSYIAVLAQKAGVAADHFWPVLVQQQVIEGWGGIGVLGASIIALATSIWLLAESLPKNNEDYMVPKQFAKCIIGGVFGIVFLMATCVNTANLTNNIAKICNPEFYAMQSLVKMVK